MRPLLVTLVGLALVFGSMQQARAEPILQIYIEGATYDDETETWVKTMSSSGDGTIRLWAIGNTGSLESPILDVKLAIAYVEEYDTYGVVKHPANSDSEEMLDIRLTPSTTHGYNDFVDPSTPEEAVLNKHEVGTTPTLYGGRDLPSHGVYGEGIAWQEFSLDDFVLYGEDADSPIIDFIAPDGGVLPDAPSPPWSHTGQINVYEVRVYPGPNVPDGEDFHGLDLHFDLYNHVEATNRTKTYFAPFSHSTDGDTPFVPAPPAYVGLIGMALMGLVGYGWQKRRGR